MDTQRAARYPFIKDAAEYVGETDPMALVTSPEYEDARMRGMERVFSAIESHRVKDTVLVKDHERRTEMLSYPYARMVVSCVRDRFLIRRYALAEASRMSDMVSTVDKDAALPLAAELGIASRRDPSSPGDLYMHFTDYLRYAHSMKASEWKLVNADIKAGEVRLSVSKFSRLLQNAIQIKIEEGLPISLPEEMSKALKQDAIKAETALSMLKKSMSPTGGEGMKEDYLPPCMKALLAGAQSGINLPHSSRFALVSFLNALGLTYEQIIALFSRSPDFDEDKSGYQIRHIISSKNGEGYTPPVCATMKTNGACHEPDNLCEKVNHPLNYYRIKSRGFKRD